MYLTRQLSDKSTQDAREILKTIIIKTKNTGILQTDDIKGEFAHSKATQPVALTPAPYLDRLPSSGKGDTSAEVNDEPKKEEEWKPNILGHHFSSIHRFQIYWRVLLLESYVLHHCCRDIDCPR